MRRRPEEADRAASGVRAYDVMGNEILPRETVLSDSPIYLLSDSAEPIVQSLGQ